MLTAEPTYLQLLSIGALAIILILFTVALLVEFIEYEAIAKLLVMPMLAVGIAVSGYCIFKSLKQS